MGTTTDFQRRGRQRLLRCRQLFMLANLNFVESKLKNAGGSIISIAFRSERAGESFAAGGAEAAGALRRSRGTALLCSG